MADRQRGRLPGRAGQPHCDHGNRLLMGLAERADVIVDFTNVPLGNYVLRQRRAGRAVRWRRARRTDFEVADPATTGQIMQFRVDAGVESST